MSEKFYCALPFKGMAISGDGTLDACCIYKAELNQTAHSYHIKDFDQWWSHGQNQLRQNFLSGQGDPGCIVCLDPVTGNHPMKVVSDRMFRQNTEVVSRYPQWLDIKFGNFCNLKCMMCTPWSSSQIEQEYRANQPAFAKAGVIYNVDKKFNDDWWRDSVLVDKMLDIVAQARFINFSGGEPLLIPAFYHMLDRMQSHAVITVNTNLTRLTDQAIELFRKFPKIHIQVSLDGVGAHHEYVRWQSSWLDIDQNIHKLIDNGIKPTFSYLLQHTSVWSWPNLWAYLKPFNPKIFVLPVYKNTLGDGTLTQNSVAIKDWQKFVDWHGANSTPYDQHINQWIAEYEFDPDKHESFKKYISTLDSIRSSDFTKTFNPSW